MSAGIINDIKLYTLRAIYMVHSQINALEWFVNTLYTESFEWEMHGDILKPPKNWDILSRLNL